MTRWFSEDKIYSNLKLVRSIFEENMVDYNLYFKCLHDSVGVVSRLVTDNPEVMHTHYVGGSLREAICISCLKNIKRGVREVLFDNLNKHRVIDIGHVNIFTTSAQELAPDYPQLYRHYIICKKVDMSVRRKVFSRLKSLIRCFENLVTNGFDMKSIVSSFPKSTFGKEWVLESCKIGTSRVKGYTHLKEDGFNSFRTVSEGEGFVNDHFETELSTPSDHIRIFHQPYKSVYREQYDFSVECPFVCMLRSTKTQQKRAVFVPFTILDLTLQVEDSFLNSITGRTQTYILSARQDPIPSLDLFGWCLRTAARGKPMSAIFYAFHIINKHNHSRDTIKKLDKLCTLIYESFPMLPDELYPIKEVVRAHDSNMVPLFMPLCVPTHVRGLRWVTKEGKAYRTHAFVHDFYAVLRSVTDSLMASYVLENHCLNIDFIDSLTVENI